ncbi:MAG: cyclase family protein [Chloroflexi bacterium]|nr:cyclase family protein [Chloroflexota bacterium]MBA3586065.1 cyclase family protein [Chloroflexota bacterium]
MTDSNTPSTRTDEELLHLAARLSNAGRWGPDDELGTLNHISAAKRVEAASLVRTGLTVSLARPLIRSTDPTSAVELDRRFFANARPDRLSGAPPFAGEYLGLDTHQQGVTHLDAVGHVGGADGSAYGGRLFSDSINDEGLCVGSVFAQRDGIVSRGVLLDVPAALGRDWLAPPHEITPADLEAAERHAGVTVGRGDVLVVRAGIEPREATEGPSPLGPGPGPDAAAWMYERDVALYTGDAPEHITALAARILGRTEVEPNDGGAHTVTMFPLPFHQLALASMGLVLLDHARVEPLAEICREIGRYEFLFIVAPLALPAGTGSPVNPLAIF